MTEQHLSAVYICISVVIGAMIGSYPLTFPPVLLFQHQYLLVCITSKPLLDASVRSLSHYVWLWKAKQTKKESSKHTKVKAACHIQSVQKILLVFGFEAFRMPLSFSDSLIDARFEYRWVLKSLWRLFWLMHK